jgi:hypothetical protein
LLLFTLFAGNRSNFGQRVHSGLSGLKVCDVGQGAVREGDDWMVWVDLDD